MRAILLSLLTLLAPAALGAPSDDYPRTVRVGDETLRVHRPVIEQWDAFRAVEGWVPIEIVDGRGEPRRVGAVRARAATEVDLDERLVRLSDQQVIAVRFSDGEPAGDDGGIAARAVRDTPQTVLLDTLLRFLADDFEVPAQAATPVLLNDAPPRIEVVGQPTGLLLIDEQPVRAPVTGTDLETVVNTDWTLFHHRPSGNWYVLNDGTWQTHSLLATGGWRTTVDLPDDFRLLSLSDEWPTVREALPARRPATEPPPFIVSLEPTELVVIDGEPRLEALGETPIRRVANADRPLFALAEGWYFPVAGRWFRADALTGPWSLADRLPEAFARWPGGDRDARLRSTIPGTVEARMALMEAALPRYRAVGEADAAGIAVDYVGEPRFEAIEGVDLARAVNTEAWVFAHNNLYYLCDDAAWFLASDPRGPWRVARSLPDEIDRIPATDPAYFVTFVKPVPDPRLPDATPRFEYNAGYLGEYSDGATVVLGTGWYHPPWVGYGPAGIPAYRGYPPTYGWPHRVYGYGYGGTFYPGYAGTRSVTFGGRARDLRGETEPAFQGGAGARRGYDYTLLGQPPAEPAPQASGADDDYYTDRAGNVYRRSDGQWVAHTGGGWSTMSALEARAGVNPAAPTGLVDTREPQRQAYRQNPDDIERMERYYESRRRSQYVHGYVYTR